MLDRSKELLATVARALGGNVRLEPRHRQVPLCDGAAVSVVMGNPPRMVLPALVNALGLTNARRYIEQNLVPYFRARGVHELGSSTGVPNGTRLDDPQQTLDNPRRRLDEYMGGAIETIPHPRQRTN